MKMAEKSRTELMLEVIKILIWPVLIVSGIFWLGDDFKEILKSRTWKIGGVIEVGDRISNLQSTLQDELISQKDALNKIIANSADPVKVRNLAAAALKDIESAQKGVAKEIENIQQTIPETQRQLSGQSFPQEANRKNPRTARDWENIGFKHLISRDVASAIQAFSEAEKIWPDYHNVSEIRQLLVRNKELLETKESAAWKELYQTLLRQYSWGMPPEIRQEVQKNLQQT